MKNLKNNKGFSLVELIIVVAIMAILIGVLAPQYLKYVERTRLTTDNDYVDAVRKAVETVAADPAVTLTQTAYKIDITSSSATVSTGNTDTGFRTAVDSIVDLDANPIFKSKAYNGKTVSVSLSYDANGVPSITVTGQIFGS